jgi:hypothetical protein
MGITRLSTGNTKGFICKQLSKLPPVICEWQQSCKQPQCSHFCDGGCVNPGREAACSPCPFDSVELPLVDAEP